MKKIISVCLVVLTLVLLMCSCAADKKLERGIISETAYTNESIGLTFNLPSGWRFYTDDEIANLMEMTKEQLRDDSLLESADVSNVIEFMAVDTSNNGNSLNLVIENLKASKSEDITIERFAEVTKQKLNGQIQGMTYTFGEDAKVKLGGEDYLRIEVKCTYQSISMSQYTYIKKIGAYIVSIATTTMNDTPPSTFEGMFS